MEPKGKFTKKALRDYKLVCLAQKNNQKAFNQLMKNYEKSIFFLMLKMTNNEDDAKDLTSEAFEKAFRNLHNYTPNYAFSTWLFRIASNNCIDYIRKGKKNLQYSNIYDEDNNVIEYVSNLSSDELDPEENIMKSQKTTLIRQIVDKLKPHYRELIDLHYFQEYNYNEISEIMNIPIGTVKAQLFRARGYLSNSIRHSQLEFIN